MKKHVIFLISMMVLFTFVMTNCEVEEEPGCEETAQPEITRGFSIDVYVYYKDSVPWEGLITMKFWKEYCSEEISGEHEFTDFCDSDGNYYPDAIPTYKLANTLDRVYVRFTVVGNDDYWYEDQVVYLYEDVKPLIAGVNHTYDIYLPWASWER
ncbi:MAG: hypothetical protein V2I47_12165 [Bacteroidales bacterium]|jgi:hypothetical protein|nr:hypothetical protein [Bacteroidales bacterium]